KLWVASLQSTGLLLRDGAAGGIVHDVGRWMQLRYPDQQVVRPLASGAVHTAGLLYRVSRGLPSRGRTKDPRPPLEPTAMPETLATSYVVTTLGMGLARGFVASRGALESYFGPGPSKRALARLVNAGLWAGGGGGVYSAGVAPVGGGTTKGGGVQRARWAYGGGATQKGGPGLSPRPRQSAGVGQPREPAPVRRSRPAGT